MKVIDAVLRLKDRMTPVLKQASDSLREHEKVNRRTAKSIKQTGASMERVGKTMSLFVAPLAAWATEGVRLSAQFQAGMAKVSTLVDTNLVDMERLKAGIRNVSDETGVSVTELAEAEYQAISAGVDAAHVTEFIAAAAKLATAGFTSVSTAVDTTTKMLNAYGQGAEEAARISDLLIITQNKGVTTVDQLGQQLGKVVPAAAAARVSQEELLASMAALTKGGMGTEQAATSLKAAISSIIKPTSEAAKAAEALGIQFNVEHLQQVGFAKFLTEIKEKTNGDVAVLGKLFSSTEALNGILSLTSDTGGQAFIDTLTDMKQVSGMTDDAFRKLMESDPTMAMRVSLNSLHNAAMDVGQTLSPVLLTTSKAIRAVASALKRLSPEQKKIVYGFIEFAIAAGITTLAAGKLISVFGSLYGGAIKFGTFFTRNISKITAVLPKCITKIRWFVGVFKTLLGGLRFAFVSVPVVAGILAVIYVLTLVAKHFTVFKQVVTTVCEKVAAVAGPMIERVTRAFDRLGGAVDRIFTEIGRILEKFGISLGTSAKVAELVLNTLGSAFTVTFDIIISVVGTAVAVIADILTGIANYIADVVRLIHAILTGDFRGAWEAAKDIVQDVVDMISHIIGDAVQGWHELLAAIFGEAEAAHTAVGDAGNGVDAPGYWTGTPYFSGGVTWVHEQGPELVTLPNGSSIIPHSESLRSEYRRGRQDEAKHTGSSLTVSIPRLADTIVVKETADIERIAETIVFKIKQASVNRMVGAV